MQVHATLDEARSAADSRIAAILEIDHEQHGRCYIKSYLSLDALRRAMTESGKSLTGVRSILAEHSRLTPEQAEAARTEQLSRRTLCDRCGTEVDERTCYSQTESARLGGRRVRVVARYCAACTTLLRTAGAGERTDMEERAATVAVSAPHSKPDTY